MPPSHGVESVSNIQNVGCHGSVHVVKSASSPSVSMLPFLRLLWVLLVFTPLLVHTALCALQGQTEFVGRNWDRDGRNDRSLPLPNKDMGGLKERIVLRESISKPVLQQRTRSSSPLHCSRNPAFFSFCVLTLKGGGQAQDEKRDVMDKVESGPSESGNGWREPDGPARPPLTDADRVREHRDTMGEEDLLGQFDFEDEVRKMVEEEDARDRSAPPWTHARRSMSGTEMGLAAPGMKSTWKRWTGSVFLSPYVPAPLCPVPTYCMLVLGSCPRKPLRGGGSQVPILSPYAAATRCTVLM